MAEDRSASRRLRLSWADLLRCVFGIDGLACSRCFGRLRLIGVVYEPTAVEGILAALSLPVTEPPRARARAPLSPDPDDDRNDDSLPPSFGEAAGGTPPSVDAELHVQCAQRPSPSRAEFTHGK